MTPPRRSKTLRGKRVGIAGAGLAGLTAAWALQRRGAETFVFEARHRIGGRVFTIDNLPGAAHAELGAEIIEEKGKDALTAVAKEAGAAMRRILPGGFHYYSGSVRGGGTLTSGKKMFDRLRELLRDEIEAFERAESLPSSAIAQRLGAESALSWAKRSKRPREAVSAVESLRGFFVAEPSEYSLLMLVQVLSEEGDPASMKMYRFNGGNRSLVEALAGSLVHEVQTASRVVRVENGRATIDTRGRRHTFACDAFVVAVPATLAREIDFVPRLPALQWKATSTLPYGRATKAIVTFDRRFWRRRGHAFATKLPIGAVWEAGIRNTRGALAFLAGGDASSELADLVAGGTHHDWQRALRWLGIGDAKVIDVAAVTWEKDPYAKGAYAHQSPAFDPALSAWLSKPAGRIAFAGEHTSGDNQGYMEGAVASGLRAADDIELILRNG
jgi:monoamine oxidase